MRMSPAKTDTGTRELAPERPRPPPTLISPQSSYPHGSSGWPSSEVETRRWEEEERAHVRRGQKWQGGVADRSGPESGVGGSYAPPGKNADEASRWPTRPPPPSPSPWVSAPLPPTMTTWPPPPGGRRSRTTTTATAPFWTRFDDVDRARYKSNQTGLAKIGRMMVTPSGQSFRDAYGVGKSISSGRGSGTETSWLQETEAQLQQEGGAAVGAWGWGGGGGGGGSAGSAWKGRGGGGGTGSEVSGWTAR